MMKKVHRSKVRRLIVRIEVEFELKCEQKEMFLDANKKILLSC